MKRGKSERSATVLNITFYDLIVQIFATQAKRKTIEKNTAAAHARHKITFNPQALESEGAGPSAALDTASTEKKKRRVSMGQAVDAETGQVVINAKRQSRRTHTVNSTTALVSRLKDAESKKVSSQLLDSPAVHQCL